MSNRAVVVELTPEERKALANPRTAPFRQVQRARLILLAAGGATNTQISQEVDLSRSMVARWRERFVRHRLDGLTDQPRPGRPRVYAEADRLRVVEAACNGRPPSTQWSVRSLAKATGVGRDTVHKILREHKLKPHRIGTFSHSPDPDFVAKVVDVVGLYLDPPENAVVVCVDEKTQVQALDRRQPMLPMRPGQIERRTH
ncbi:MAG: IS630 family transposase, partial [Candidatus Acetothermia bacterium]|nr:IS630 family transposase [Candidatus Acetothermia bacterium]